MTQQVWVLENKNLTLCTSLPGCYLCRNSREWRKNSDECFSLQNSRGRGRREGDARKTAVFYLGALRWEHKFTSLNVSNTLLKRFFLESRFPESYTV